MAITETKHVVTEDLNGGRPGCVPSGTVAAWRPLISDQLTNERLGKPTALAVLSSDVMSSSAYATEEILRVLVPIGGLAAFGLVTPITLVILVVLAIVTICYREVVK